MIIPRTLDVIDLSNKNKNYWDEAKKYFKIYKSGVKTLKDFSIAEKLMENDLSWVYLNKPKRRQKYIRIIFRSKRLLSTLKDVLISQSLEDQALYLDRFNSKGRYRYDCRFHITVENIESIVGYNLLERYGWYNSIDNPNGVVKDHRLSVKYGFDNSISSDIIGNIKNCEFLRYIDNARKSSDCSITLIELLTEINK